MGQAEAHSSEQSEEHDAGKICEVRVRCYELRVVVLGCGVDDRVGHRQAIIQTSPCCQDGKFQVKGNQAITKGERLRKEIIRKIFPVLAGYFFVDLEYYYGRKE